MSMMQPNDSRLLKAAKRTIRAEFTLVLVVVIITSWSLYALYKIAITGSNTDSILGFNISRIFVSTYSDQQQPARQSDSFRINEQQIKPILIEEPQRVIYSQPMPSRQEIFKNQIVQEILAKRRQLFGDQQAESRPQQANAQNPNQLKIEALLAELKRRTKFQQQQQQQQQQQNVARAQPKPNLSSLLQLNPNLRPNLSMGQIKVNSAAASTKPLMEIDDKDIVARDPDAPTNQEESATDSDREASESSSNPSESLTNDSDNGIPASESQNDNSNDKEENETPPDQSNESTTDQEEDGKIETTTPEPPTVDVPQPEVDSELSNEGVPRTVDDDVDRIAQPSGSEGLISRQDNLNPFDYKNTVQFDDSIATLGAAAGKKARQGPKRTNVTPGELIHHFEDPNIKLEVKEKSKKQLILADSKVLNDLQVDHNILKTISDDDKAADVSIARSLQSNNSSNIKKGPQYQPGNLSELMKKIEKIEKVRVRRALNDSNRISATHELDIYLESLNFDDLIGQASSMASKINPKVEEDDLIRMSLGVPTINASEQPVETNKTQIPNRRNDAEDEEDEEEDSQAREEPSEQENQPESGEDKDGGTTNQFYQNAYPLGSQPMSYNNHNFNDSDILNLLAEKRLLDALSQSQLPAPIKSPSYNYSDDSSIKPQDHQAAGSLFTVDHGLLLTPSAEEETHFKSKSSKKKKAGKMKKKKKMTVAMKKGGHKKKKHKKLEKKFLKEKKFKGAKKGKKMSKGKGGQGGKKGKKLYKDKGFKKKGFKNVYHKEEFGHKKSYFDEYRDKDFKKKWKKFDDKYNYAQMKKWQAKDVKGAKKYKDHGEKFKKYDKSKWKKKYHKDYKEHMAKESMKKKKKHSGF